MITTRVGDIGPLFADYRLGIVSDGTVAGYEAALTRVIVNADRQRLCIDAPKIAHTHLNLFNRVASIEQLYLTAKNDLHKAIH